VSPIGWAIAAASTAAILFQGVRKSATSSMPISPRRCQLQCEVQYSVIFEGNPIPKLLQGRKRADLVVAQRSARREAEPIPKFIIEVKRASAPTSQINADLSRLAAVGRLCPDVRTFMFVISEAKRPTRFVNDNGHSVLGTHHIPGCDSHYRIRRTWKAAHAFTRRDRAQYACLIEVYPDRRKLKRQHAR